MVDKGKSVALRTDPVVIEALAEHTATVIFIHGLSDTPDVLLGPVEHWRGNGQLDHVKFVLPYAPVIAFTAKGGVSMPAWYDIVWFPSPLGLCCGMLVLLYSKSTTAPQMRFRLMKTWTAFLPAGTTFKASSTMKSALEPRKQHNNCWLFPGRGGSFSRRPDISADSRRRRAALSMADQWYLPLIESFKEHVPEDNASKETPIFLGHGIEDCMVTLGLAKKSQDALTAMGFEISWDVYPGLGHATCEDELDDVEAFIDENLS